MDIALDPSSSLREQVAERVKLGILVGEFAFGQTYTVPALAARFGISATPMREAVLDLVKERLLFTVPGRGFRLQEDPIDVVVSIAQTRHMIEIPATIEAAAYAREEDLIQLSALAQDLVAFAADHSVRAYLRADLEFHRRILSWHPNAVLVAIIDSLQSRARLHALPYTSEPGVLIEPSGEHLVLVDALARRDPDGIRMIMDHHISFSVEAAERPDTKRVISAG